jgi:putative PIN family toxin of toxin-antitoxin system
VKVVLDTNVLIAAFVARGVCHELVEHVVRQHDPCTSDFILGEFRRKLTGKLRVPRDLVAVAVELQLSRMRRVQPVAVPESICRDPADAAVLGTALAADAACLVTGDGDLLVLRKHRGIHIFGPGSFWQFEAG